MDLVKVIKLRHSVRRYLDKPIEIDKINKINEFIHKLNLESKLNIQFITQEPTAFDCFMSHYGKFSGVKNYFAMVGKNDKTLQEKVGYYGEKLVLYCQSLGLNTCWVAISYKKNKNVVKIEKGQKLSVVVAVGYGENQGFERKSKIIEKVCFYNKNTPTWFIEGVKCALLAPTAMNQQKFYFKLVDDKVSIKNGVGFYTKMDLGIVKYHFEIGAGIENFTWDN